jgi:vanillate O-demethylase ferredoxin subunit
MSARLVMKLRVEAAEPSTPEVTLFTLAHRTRPELPAWTPGAHVDLRLPDGRVRQYSLCGDPAERGRWRIAVKREEEGRGGSRWCHESLAPGAPVLVSAPRNNFPLADTAARHVLVGGGIGVTPLAAMARHLLRTGADFTLHHAARAAAQAPLLPELRALCGDRLVTWFGDEGRRFHPGALGPPAEGTHLYLCGPPGMTDAVRAAATTAGWPEAQVHAEAFQPPSDEKFAPEPFDILLASTGARLHVPADRTALAALRDAGIDLPSACENGICGSCLCGYRDGAVVHRDQVLPAAERTRRMAPCVSRARGRVTLEL